MRAELPVVDLGLDIEQIRRHLSAYTVGRRLCLYDAVTSTNAVLRDLAAAGAAEGTVVLAETQTAGRGRGGKRWFSPPGLNLYASILLRPATDPATAGVLSFVGSLAVADAIRELGLFPAIKWPNDVLVHRHKVAGILAEVAVTGDRIEHMILGIGANLNVQGDALRAGLGEAARQATSLREALGRPVDRNAFAGTVLSCLDEWLVTFREQGGAPLLSAWRALDIVSGRRVEVREDSIVFDGRARGVDADGRLEVEDARGRVHRVVAGEVRLLE